jgi:hypothetical protein
MKFAVAAVMLSALLAGCASSHILMGQKRPAIPVDQVKLYFKPPAKYEEIAIIEASSQGAFAFTNQSKMNAAIGRLKGEAAKLGANGVLLQGTGSEVAGMAGTGYATNGVLMGSAAAAISKTGNGLAIYVTEE